MSTVLDKQGKPMRLVAAANTTPLADAAAKPLHVCNCGNDVIAIAEYMVEEMKRNPFSAPGRKITEANAYDIGKEMAVNLERAGFSRVRLEIRQVNPVSVACALGIK